MNFPETGKIQNQFFKEMVFPFCGAHRPEVWVGPEYGVDVSLVKLPHGLAMAMTSDPLSLIPTLGLRESAWLSVQLMANDMSTTGLAPQYVQFTLNLPMSLSAEAFQEYWNHIHEFCARLDIAITGGHTGRVEGIHSTVAGGGTMTTIAPESHFITSKGARPGDIVVMTKSSALIATSILSRSFPQRVRAVCGDTVQQQAAGLFYETSAVEAGLAAGTLHRQTQSITAMHDVTEGGIIGALYELGHASRCGLWIDEQQIPVGDIQENVCGVFDIDPRHCVGAGSMIITVKPEFALSLVNALADAHIPATAIGKVTAVEEGLILKKGNTQRTLEHPGTDPYWAAFFKALNNGWT